jgi:large subunit ribosomal protein L21
MTSLKLGDEIDCGWIQTAPMCQNLKLRRAAWNETMYAIVKTGGKQYKAAKNDVIIVEKLEGEAGTAIDLSEVVMLVDGDKTTVGSPHVKGAMVRGEIVRQAKAPKINAFNYKPKKNERKRWGHRQRLTHIKILEVQAGS